jgi:hypothetical protein
MRHGVHKWAGVMSIGAVALACAACSGQAGDLADKHAGPDRLAVAAAGYGRPYPLYTHCGIDEARIGGHYFEAVHPLSDGAGNPPAGWGNPYQQGTMLLLSPAVAVFSDDAGHHVVFRLRPGARAFEHLCE